MVKTIKYPSEDKIIELNMLVLQKISVKKADKAEVLSKPKLTEILDECMEHSGDVYDKAVILLKGLVQKHPFASGNRRTAFVVAKDFLTSNNKPLKIRDNPEDAKTMQGIRENYYTDEELKEWIQYGKIRTFRR